MNHINGTKRQNRRNVLFKEICRFSPADVLGTVCSREKVVAWTTSNYSLEKVLDFKDLKTILRVKGKR